MDCTYVGGNIAKYYNKMTKQNTSLCFSRTN